MQSQMDATVNRLSYSQKERKRLEEVVRDQDDEIKILLEGGSGFRRIKELMGGLTNTVDQLQSEADESAKGVVIVRNILTNIDEIFKNRAEPPVDKVKKKRKGKGEDEDDEDHNCDANRVVMAGGSRGKDNDDLRDKNMSALDLKSNDGIIEKNFKNRSEFLVAKNNVFMTEEELRLFKEDFIKKLIEKERRKKIKMKEEGA